MKNFRIRKGLSVLVCILGFITLSFGQTDLDDLEALEAEFAETESTEETDAASSEDAPYQMDSEESAPYQMDSDEPSEEENVESKLPPHTGTYKILISRPIYAPYNQETETKWISAIGEMFFHYKVGSFPRTYAFTPGQIDDVLPNYRDYSKRISLQAYVDAAKKLGATHLLYQEYEPQGKKNVRYAVELLSLVQNGSVIKVNQTFKISDFEKGLNSCLAPVAQAMDPAASSTTAFSQNMFGKNVKNMKRFGNTLAEEGIFNEKSASATLSSIEKMVKKNSKHIGYRYSAAAIAARAGKYDKAIDHMDAVIAKSGDYPALHLSMASYYRNAERYSEALNATQIASKSSSLATPVARQRAMIYQKQGKLDQASQEYNSILQSGEADGNIYFRLALLSIQMGKIEESNDYIRKAEDAGLTLDQSENIQLGKAYAELSGQETLALEYLKKGLGTRQDNEDAWKLMAEIHERTGSTSEAAKCYISLFHLDNDKYKDKLKQAGEIYENNGNMDEAKNAYALFLDRRYVDNQVRLSLGKIHFNENNCGDAKKVLKGMDTIPEARTILEECGVTIRTPIDTDWGPKTSPVILTLRWSTAILAIGGAVGGYLMDEEVKKLYITYKEARNQELTLSSKEDIKSKQKLRNGLYGLAGAAAVSLSATFFF
ncbi:MAG: tetratricopeptide repeat protein [Chitinispirillaceae bacterium]